MCKFLLCRRTFIKKFIAIITVLANGMLTRDNVGDAVYMAADCNHDGAIDESDIALLNEAGTLLANVDQSKSADVLLETSSEYIEYLELIDQAPELEFEELTGVETENGVQQESTESDFIDMIIGFIKSIFAKLFEYIPAPIK